MFYKREVNRAVVAPEFESLSPAERHVSDLLVAANSFAHLVDSLPSDHPATTGLQLWGAIHGYYPRAPLPLSAQAPRQGHISAPQAND